MAMSNDFELGDLNEIEGLDEHGRLMEEYIVPLKEGSNKDNGNKKGNKFFRCRQENDVNIDEETFKADDDTGYFRTHFVKASNAPTLDELIEKPWRLIDCTLVHVLPGDEDDEEDENAGIKYVFNILMRDGKKIFYERFVASSISKWMEYCTNSFGVLLTEKTIQSRSKDFAKEVNDLLTGKIDSAKFIPSSALKQSPDVLCFIIGRHIISNAVKDPVFRCNIETDDLVWWGKEDWNNDDVKTLYFNKKHAWFAPYKINHMESLPEALKGIEAAYTERLGDAAEAKHYVDVIQTVINRQQLALHGGDEHAPKLLAHRLMHDAAKLANPDMRINAKFDYWSGPGGIGKTESIRQWANTFGKEKNGWREAPVNGTDFDHIKVLDKIMVNDEHRYSLKTLDKWKKIIGNPSYQPHLKHKTADRTLANNSMWFGMQNYNSLAGGKEENREQVIEKLIQERRIYLIHSEPDPLALALIKLYDLSTAFHISQMLRALLAWRWSHYNPLAKIVTPDTAYKLEYSHPTCIKRLRDMIRETGGVKKLTPIQILKHTDLTQEHFEELWMLGRHKDLGVSPKRLRAFFAKCLNVDVVQISDLNNDWQQMFGAAEDTGNFKNCVFAQFGNNIYFRTYKGKGREEQNKQEFVDSVNEYRKQIAEGQEAGTLLMMDDVKKAD